MQDLERRMGNLPFKAKIGILFACLAFLRLGSVLPLPFVNQLYMELLLGSNLGFLNSITGGSLYQMSLFALSISPYITASIIIQLLCVVIRPLDEMRKDGKSGQEKYKRITIASSILLALLQAAAMAVGLGRNGLLDPYNASTVIGATVIWTLGAALLVTMGEMLTWLGIGSGISFILVANILANLPSDVASVGEVFLSSGPAAIRIVRGVIILSVALAMVAVCVALTKTEKRLRITNSRKITGMADNNFPIPLCTCSVMPVIFASSLISMPTLASRFVPSLSEGITGHVIRALNSSSWFLPEQPLYTLGAVVYFLLTTFFAWFYLDIGFNSLEIADNLKKGGTVIPGIRPGKPTAEYIRNLSLRIALLGNTLMVSFIILMHAACNLSGLSSLSIAGTSIFICVSVIMEEKKLAESIRKVSRYQKKSTLFVLS